jgi:glycosyltransferase involved in cell wall biosynthesis
MKVLIATGIYPPSVGGPATYSKLLYDNLPSHDIDVVVASFDNLRALPVGVRHFLYFIKVLIEGIGKDIIYAQDPVSVGYPAMWAAKILKKKFVLKIVGDYAWEQGVQRFGVQESLDDFVKDLREYNPRVLRMKKIQKKVAESADKIIVPSRYLKKIVGQWGINENKINVIYNAFEGVGELPDDMANLRDEVGFVGPTIVTAGRLVPWKGFETLMTVVDELKDEFKYIKLLIIGGGPDKQKLEQMIVKKQLFKNVLLTGVMDKQNLFKHIAAADLFVLNTGYEGFSHQLLEVLALKTPIITTRIGGNPEIIIDGENGLLVNYDDKEELKNAIRKVLNDKSLGENFVTKGEDSVKEFSLNRMITELVMEFKTL